MTVWLLLTAQSSCKLACTLCLCNTFVKTNAMVQLHAPKSTCYYLIGIIFFFNFIDYPFALCVNFNSWEGISMMRENKIFEYNCQNKSQPSTCRHGFFTGFKLLQKWQYSYHRIPFLKIYLKNHELEIKSKYECSLFRNSTFASLGCDWGADRTQQWVQTEQPPPQEPPVQHYPAPPYTHANGAVQRAVHGCADVKQMSTHCSYTTGLFRHARDSVL